MKASAGCLEVWMSIMSTTVTQNLLNFLKMLNVFRQNQLYIRFEFQILGSEFEIHTCLIAHENLL
jgi:hypothetical protein